jgi:hypothetical protein
MKDVKNTGRRLEHSVSVSFLDNRPFHRLHVLSILNDLCHEKKNAQFLTPYLLQVSESIAQASLSLVANFTQNVSFIPFAVNSSFDTPDSTVLKSAGIKVNRYEPDVIKFM